MDADRMDAHRIHRRRLLTLAALLPFAGVATVDAHENHKQRAAPAEQAPKSVKVALADTPLVDQDGRKLRLKSDLMAGRIVVVDFIYTTCTTICPIFTATMASVQEKLADVIGRDVQLVTVTVDPLRDTPRRLKDYAAKHHAEPTGWSFVTGAKSDVDAVNKAFGSYTANIDDHPPMVMVGDTANGQWTRFYGFPTANELEKRVRDLMAARKGTS
jgi:protein SCO1/2